MPLLWANARLFSMGNVFKTIITDNNAVIFSTDLITLRSYSRLGAMTLSVRLAYWRTRCLLLVWGATEFKTGFQLACQPVDEIVGRSG